ncbi:MAG: YybH family protein [Panacagrimonas sp.]
MDTVKAWLDRFAESVRSQNFVEGETLFDDRVFSFGTVIEVVDGLAALRTAQWEKVWPVTRDFRFSDKDTRILLGADRTMAVVNALWTSESARTFELRRGRSTLVLQRHEAGAEWKAVHSHFSLSPSMEGSGGSS